MSLSSFCVDETPVTPVSSVRNIGVMFDNSMSMKSHDSHVCRVVSFHLRNIGRARKFLTQNACEQLVHSLVSSRIDYSNSLLHGIAVCQIKRLQRLLNIAARIVTKTPPTQHITPVLQALHWLPVKQRISYKILLLTFKALNGQGPQYISELLIPLERYRSLRSTDKKMLVIPKTRCKTLGDRSFAHAAPVLWNMLPESIKNISELNAFKSSIKTYLFKQAYQIS